MTEKTITPFELASLAIQLNRAKPAESFSAARDLFDQSIRFLRLGGEPTFESLIVRAAEQPLTGDDDPFEILSWKSSQKVSQRDQAFIKALNDYGIHNDYATDCAYVRKQLGRLQAAKVDAQTKGHQSDAQKAWLRDTKTVWSRMPFGSASNFLSEYPEDWKENFAATMINGQREFASYKIPRYVAKLVALLWETKL